LTAHTYIPRVNVGGNFCGHRPFSPSFTLKKPAKKGKGGLPRVLTLCMERLTNYYYRPGTVIPSLNLANGSSRQQRSERREACVCLLAALLKRTDLTSLKVGIPTKNGFINYTVDYIAKDTDMTLKRVERALKDLKSSGIITVSQFRQLLPNGSWKSFPAVKAVSKYLFGVFGLASMLEKERKKAIKRLERKNNEQIIENNATIQAGKFRFALFMKSLTGKARKTSKKKKKTFDSTHRPSDLNKRKWLMLKASEIKQNNPDWDRARCYKEAERLV
jgi:hypothetical protein